jgi:hypothetical protein
MFGPNVGQIAKLVAALTSGDDNLLDKILHDKLDELGEEFLMKTLAGPFAGTDKRIGDAIQTGGMSELQHLGQHFLSTGMSQPWQKIVSSAYAPLRRRVHGQHSPRSSAAWARTDWATSRDDWLDNRWKHDWRSQPRDARGRWIPGRLQTWYVTTGMRYRGTHAGRKKRRTMKTRRLERLRGRRAARSIMKKFRRKAPGKYGG